jgi:tRNA G10  N-methylase Trm11
MSTYIFILGKDPELSLAELKARYEHAKLHLKGPDFALLELDRSLDQMEFNRLGGQIKAGRVFNTISKKGLIEEIMKHLLSGHSSGKLNYGISVYNWSEKNLRSLLLDLKKGFKKQEISSRFANQRFLNISAAQHKGLRGAKEILVCKNGPDFVLAEVVAVQDIDSYSKRDYKKPFRDMKVGMLPPKLAQIMINLSGSKGIIWDPFCGGGVLIMEGLLMGHAMLGSDINQMTLNGAQKNVEWLKREYEVRVNADLFVHDATKPVSGKKFDSIVCEGYLGPPQNRLKSRRELSTVTAEVTALYQSFFRSLKVSSFKGPIVIGLPFYKVKEGILNLTEAITAIEKMGFKKEVDLNYARKDQLVGRHILRFRLN